MSASNPAIKVAFIGMGPRALGALEALVENCMAKGQDIAVSVFDELQLGGAGPNFDPDQSEFGLLNTPMRALQIDPSLDLPCGGFNDWQKKLGEPDNDRFASRAELGAYLEQRYKDVVGLSEVLTVTCHKARATALHRDEDHWRVETETKDYGPFDEILLVPGQPQTKTDDQWATWEDHAEKRDLCCLQAYPDRHVLKAASEWSDRKVGIRGLGLSTFDVLRYLTVGQGGAFENDAYQPSGSEPECIYAFSLNGQPPFPKPVDGMLDQRFDLKDPEIENFVAALNDAVAEAPDQALTLIFDALVQPAARIGSEMFAGYDVDDIREWLEIERNAPGDQETHEPVDTLRHGITMADGSAPPTVGYVIGQIWRKLQNDIRAGFNSAEKLPETTKAIVGFDEGLKRYSYGPPLSSARELLALIDCKLVSLAVVEDPDIALVRQGWRLIDDKAATVSVMINAVLAPPSLDKITDPLVVKLKSANILRETYEGAGAHTTPDGQVVNADGDVTTGLCVLGRLSLGSVIAVDSVHDCFGASTQRWAEGVISRMQGR